MSDSKVEIINSTKEQVALDMAKQIQYNSSVDYTTEKAFLTLYRKCYKASSGHSLESILEDN